MSFPYTSNTPGTVRGARPSAYRIGRVFGIDLCVHRWFLYMFAMLVLVSASSGLRHGVALEQSLGTAILLLIVSVLIVLHELGHSLVAQRFGIQVVDITLWPLGGMARMAEIPEDSRTEALVAIAGPAVNFVLAALGTALFMVLFGASGFEATFLAWGPAQVLGWFILVNLGMGTFNLVPAFPMDGGRLLRAFFGRNGDYLRATERAVKVGQFCALTMIFGFFFTPGWCFLPLIGVFVLWAGTRELFAMRMKHAVGAAGGGANPLEEFLRRGMGGMGGMGRGSSEPGPGPAQDSPPSSPGGFSEEDIERLERFRGRLQPPDERPE